MQDNDKDRDDWRSRKNLFTDLEDSDDFEEPDRDSDYAAVYTEVEEEESDFPEDEPEFDTTGAETAEEDTPWDDEEDYSGASAESTALGAGQKAWTDREPASAETWAAISTLSEEEPYPDPLDDDEEDWEEDAYEAEERETSLPLGMIIVGVVALLLLGFGGYGVMQDRAALQEEIRQLEADLAATASPAEVAEARTTSAMLTARNRELEQEVSELSRENRSLQAIIGGLESQLEAQQEVLEQAKTPPPAAPVKAAPKAAPKPAPKQAAPTQAAPTATTASAPSGTWFVNFGSYSQRATAESWARRLQPDAGEVVVATGEKDGRTFYRVRVVALPSDEVAQATARKLEQTYGLSRLWVGRSP